MSSIATDKGILHYEVTGRGKPVIFLHGWLGSWRLWEKTMLNLSGEFRTYALDFWGFGESDRKLDSYEVLDFVNLILQFMDQMGIEKAPLIGHSMGGTVSLLFGLAYPNRVSKIAIIGSPINGASLAFPLKIAGKKLFAAILFSNMYFFRKIMRFVAPSLSNDSDFSNMMDNDITNTNINSFLISISSLRRTDITNQIGDLEMPLLGMYGKNDNIVSPKQLDLIKAKIPNANVEYFLSSGHFIMLDEPIAFSNSVMNFLNK